MRVGFLSYAPAAGGISTFQAHNIDWLAAQGVECFLVDERPETSLARLTTHRGVEVRTMPVWSDPASARLQLARWVREWQPTVIHTSNPALVLRYAAELLRARRRTGTRVILTHHSEMLQPTMRRHLVAAGSSVMALMLDEITWVSGYTRRWWTRRFPCLHAVPSRLTPNGVPLPARVRPFTSGPEVRVGFVGRLSREKGLDRFIDVAARMHGTGFSFAVFGEGPDRSRIAPDTPLQWYGHLTDPDMIYAGIDVLMVTSPVENCPYAVLEARARGIPCVVPPVGGLPEMVTDAVDGVVAESRGTDDLVTALTEAASRLAVLARGCLNTRRRWTLESAAVRLWNPWLGGSFHSTGCGVSGEESHAVR